MKFSMAQTRKLLEVCHNPPNGEHRAKLVNNPVNNTPFHGDHLMIVEYILATRLFLYPNIHNYTSIHDICGPNETDADVDLYQDLQAILYWDET